MSDEDDVLEANAAFYRAFADRDADAMEGLWAKASPVACIHPGWPPLLGRRHVMASWRGVLGSPNSPSIRCLEPSAHILSNAAFVICYEVVDDARLAATNVFVREDDAWRVVHHQASPVAAEVEIEEDAEPDPSSLN